MELLPHRYPFLMIDRVLKMVPGEKIVAIKNVSINEPFFQGHFPTFPIMPGVLIIEGMAQAGGVLHIQSMPENQHGSPVFFMGIDKAKFRKPVTPGDQIKYEITILKQRKSAIKMKGLALVDDALVAEAELLATVGE
jgi:beta-hydroxyacyl-ACP dehydratase FabZ